MEDSEFHFNLELLEHPFKYHKHILLELNWATTATMTILSKISYRIVCRSLCIIDVFRDGHMINECVMDNLNDGDAAS